MSNQRPTTFTFSLLALCAGACATGEAADEAGPTPVLPDAAGVTDAAPRSNPDEPLAAGYYTVSVPDGVFYVNYDDNSSGPGDPISGNDVQLVWGTLVEGPPTDLIFINLYEGIASFRAEDGSVRDFGSFELPLAIDIGQNPEEQNYNTCGLCVSVLSDITLDDGELMDYQKQFVAVGGTVTFDQLPVEPDQMFEATLTNVELAEADLYGELVPDGETRFVPHIDFTVVTAGP